MRHRLAVCVAGVLAATAHAEVTSASPTHFLLTHRAEVKATPAQAIEAVGQLPQWWNPSHSYSGQGASLRMGLRAGDCFCEQWGEGASVEHARVVQVLPGRQVRLEGALGPLQELAVRGVLTFSARAAEGGGTQLVMTYRVAGDAAAGLERLAPVVDRVMAEQFQRWAAHVGPATR